MRLTQTPGAAVVIVKDSQVVFMRGYGLKNVQSGDSIDANTLFRIGSLSKGFAGVLTGMLVKDSLLTWNDPVQQHCPDFRLRDARQSGRVQIRHLLSHTTGLPYHTYTNLIEDGLSIPIIMREFIPDVPVVAREGEQFCYQNAVFCVVEEAMQHVTGKTYAQLLSERIFGPAGMHLASADFEAMRHNRNKALPHFWTGFQWRSDTISPRYYNSAAAGGVNASIADMGEWLKVLMGHKPEVVNNATLDEVFRPIIRTHNEHRHFHAWPKPKEASYAMGWRVLEQGGDTIICHGGYVNGFKGEIAFSRRDGIGICVLFNAHTELSANCLSAFFTKWRKAGMAGSPI